MGGAGSAQEKTCWGNAGIVLRTLQDFLKEVDAVGSEFRLRREIVYARSYAAKARLHLDADAFIESLLLAGNG